jgi:hypothetical protein
MAEKKVKKYENNLCTLLKQISKNSPLQQSILYYITTGFIKELTAKSMGWSEKTI